MTRAIPRLRTPIEMADPNIPMVDNSSEKIINLRRPMVSAIGANTMEPTAMPMRPALNKYPNSTPLRPKEDLMADAVKARANTSNPSSRFNDVTSSTIPHW